MCISPEICSIVWFQWNIYTYKLQTVKSYLNDRIVNVGFKSNLFKCAFWVGPKTEIEKNGYRKWAGNNFILKIYRTNILRWKEYNWVSLFSGKLYCFH